MYGTTSRIAKRRRCIASAVSGVGSVGADARFEGGRCQVARFGIGELRIDYGPGYRVYFVRKGDIIVVLLCGGDKSTQSKDIERATKMVKEL